jgi:hypothetical protein
MPATPDQTHRLLDAIELLNAERREEARATLRALIQEDANFEDAWLWMSVAVDTLDQATVCLENVLRINPGNTRAAEALLRLRGPDMAFNRRRERLRDWRDAATGLFWMLLIGSLCATVTTYMAYWQAYRAAQLATG